MSDIESSAESTVEAPARLFGLERRRLGRWALGLLFLLLSVRLLAEVGLMREHGPDAQMPIWWAVCAFKIALWFIGGGIALALMMRLWAYRTGRLIGAALFGLWILAIGWASLQYDLGRAAMAEARDAHTPPDRLRALAHFEGVQAGYELDNRLAANRSTPPDVLRELAARPDQPGTRMLVAKNPGTPADVLAEIQRSNN